MLSRGDQQQLNKLMLLLCTAAAYGSRVRRRDGAACAHECRVHGESLQLAGMQFRASGGVNLLKLAATIKTNKK